MEWRGPWRGRRGPRRGRAEHSAHRTEHAPWLHPANPADMLLAVAAHCLMAELHFMPGLAFAALARRASPRLPHTARRPLQCNDECEPRPAPSAGLGVDHHQQQPPPYPRILCMD